MKTWGTNLLDGVNCVMALVLGDKEVGSVANWPKGLFGYVFGGRESLKGGLTHASNCINIGAHKVNHSVGLL